MDVEALPAFLSVIRCLPRIKQTLGRIIEVLLGFLQWNYVFYYLKELPRWFKRMHEVTLVIFSSVWANTSIKSLYFIYLWLYFLSAFLMLWGCVSTYKEADLSCCMSRWGALAFPHTAPLTCMLWTPRGVRNRADMLARAPRGLSHKGPREGQGGWVCISALFYFSLIREHCMRRESGL